MTDESLARRTSASVIWMTAQKWITRIGGLVTIVVLTRLLTPEDFGLAAAATTLIPLIYILSDVGFSTYITQADAVGKRTLSTAFWFSVSCGTVLSGVTYACAPLLGNALDLPEVAPLIRAMTSSVLLIALGSVPIALLRRRMNFRKLAFIDVTGSLFAQVVAIGAAITGMGAWALVLQVVVAQLVNTVWVWVAAHWAPTFDFSRQDFRSMAFFGLPVVGTALVFVVRDWLYTAIIIAGLGVTEMGYINIAQRLVYTAQDLTVSALLPVSLVAFSKVRQSPIRLRSAYLRASSISYAAVTPLMIFVAVSATVLVPFLFGSDKNGSAQVTPLVTVIVLLNVGFAIDEGLHVGMGRPGRWFILILAGFSSALAILAYSVQFGLSVFMFTWLGVTIALTIIRWFFTAPLIAAKPLQVAMPVLGLMPAAALSVVTGLAMMRLLDTQSDFVILASTGLAVVFTYIVALRTLRSVTFADTIAVLPGRISRKLQWALPRSQRVAQESADPPGASTDAGAA